MKEKREIDRKREKPETLVCSVSQDNKILRQGYANKWLKLHL